MLIHGDSVEAMAAMPPGSVHVVCTDPPYGLEFMSNHVDWDVLRAPEYKTGAGFAPVGFGRESPWPAFAALEAHGGMNPTCATCGGRKRGKKQCTCSTPAWSWAGDEAPLQPGRAMQEWHARWLKEALRILVPGGWCVSFGGARTSHRLVAAAEDVGFIIKDPLFLAYGSGMNKVGYVARLIDEYLKVERPVVGYNPTRARPNRLYAAGAIGNVGDLERPASDRTDNGATQYGPGSAAAATWAGWGGSLRPAVEPIMVAQKPLAGTIAKNLLTHGAGAYNIDACRNGLANGEAPPKPAGRATSKPAGTLACEPDAGREEARQEFTPKDNSAGRWPTNLVLVHHPACEHAGVRAAPASSGIRPEQVGVDYGNRKGTTYSGPTTGKLASSYTGEDGTELLDDWICHEDCPVRQLEAQAGVGKSRYFTRLDWGHENLRDGRPGAAGDPGDRTGHLRRVGSVQRHPCAALPSEARPVGEVRGARCAKPAPDREGHLADALAPATVHATRREGTRPVRRFGNHALRSGAGAHRLHRHRA